MDSFRVVVCGGRDYADEAFVNASLDDIHHVRPISDLMQGGCKTGADAFAKAWVARHPEIIPWEFPAEFAKLGVAAGPMRNQRMADWKPDVVVSFPGGKGTADMVRKARKAGIAVMELP